MPRITPKHVVSFSSEDPNNPASNLLKKDSFRKWLCKDEGEKEAVAIFKLDKAETFTGFNIANLNSAFIEIFVARSGADASKPLNFHSILSQSQLLSPSESRNIDNNGTIGTGVKFYNSHLLNKIVAAEKWDIVKIVLSQPFNTHVRYGLSFIELNVLADVDEKPTIGGFSLRAPLGGSDDEDFNPLPVGLLFNKIKRKSDTRSPGALSISGSGESNKTLSTGAAIRQASTSLANAASSSSEAKVKELLRKRKLDHGLSSESEHLGPKQSSEMSKGSPKGQSGEPLPKRNVLDDSPRRIKEKHIGSPSAASSSPQSRLSSTNKPKKINESGGVGSSGSSSSGTSDRGIDRNNSNQNKVAAGKPTTSKRSVNRKEFGKLFEGVIFVISGFENPYRGQLRNKALEMGARCKQDWDSTCTHLLCAFVNTPKFRQVKSEGRGKIVKKEWFEASYAAKCRFPWRRYCLDRDDKGAESEDEIHAINDDGSSTDDEEVLRSTSVAVSNGNQEQEEEIESTTSELTQRSETGEEPSEHQQSSQQSPSMLRSEDEEDAVTVTEETNKKKKRKRVRVFDSEDEEESESEEVKVEKSCEEKESEGEAYDVDTDVDEDKEEERLNRRTTNDSSPEKKSNNEPRNDFFQDSVFLFHPYDSPPLNPSQRDQIEQIISRHKGKVERELTSDVEYIVTENEEWDEDFAEALSENPNLSFVRCQWIVECGRQKQMISPEPFMILPN